MTGGPFRLLIVLAVILTTSSIVVSLPVIQEAAQRAGMRPVKPVSMSVIATSIALATSPVSAAMAATILPVGVAGAAPGAPVTRAAVRAHQRLACTPAT